MDRVCVVTVDLYMSTHGSDRELHLERYLFSFVGPELSAMSLLRRSINDFEHALHALGWGDTSQLVHCESRCLSGIPAHVRVHHPRTKLSQLFYSLEAQELDLLNGKRNEIRCLLIQFLGNVIYSGLTRTIRNVAVRNGIVDLADKTRYHDKLGTGDEERSEGLVEYKRAESIDLEQPFHLGDPLVRCVRLRSDGT